MKVIKLLKGKTEVLDIGDKLETYCKLTNCDCIDIVIRTVKSKPFAFVVDDEGRFKEENRITAISKFYSARDCLVGTVVITGKPDEEGNLTSLTDDDVKLIEEHVEYGALIYD